MECLPAADVVFLAAVVCVVSANVDDLAGVVNSSTVLVVLPLQMEISFETFLSSILQVVKA